MEKFTFSFCKYFVRTNLWINSDGAFKQFLIFRNPFLPFFSIIQFQFKIKTNLDWAGGILSRPLHTCISISDTLFSIASILLKNILNMFLSNFNRFPLWVRNKFSSRAKYDVRQNVGSWRIFGFSISNLICRWCLTFRFCCVGHVKCKMWKF